DLLDRVHRARVRFSGGGTPRLTPVRQEAVYRIAQEALHNAVRHAEPGTVQGRLSTVDGSAVLQVVDDGAGFQPGGGRGAARRGDWASPPCGNGRGRPAAGSRCGRGPGPVRPCGWRCRPVGDRIRVLVVDDHQVVRQGLRTFLDLQPDIEVVGEAADGAEC